MELRVKVKDSYYLLSDEYEMFGQIHYNYGWSKPENIGVVDEEGCVALLSTLINKGICKTEMFDLDEDIDSSQDEYIDRDYVGMEEIDSLSSIIFLYFMDNGNKYYLYDIVKYKDKYLHLWLDED